MTPSTITKQFADQVRMRLISQLINSISNVLQKQFKYFNDTIISTFYVASFSILPVDFSLTLNETLLLLLLLSAAKSLISPAPFKAG